MGVGFLHFLFMSEWSNMMSPDFKDLVAYAASWFEPHSMHMGYY